MGKTKEEEQERQEMRMNNGLAIDTLHDQLLTLSRQTKYMFEMLRGDWGKTNSEVYNKQFVQFCRSMRQLAKDSPVKWFNGGYYLFNGRIYERVENSVIEQAYQLLLEDLGIAPMLSRTAVRKETFLEVIRQYNILVPQFDVVAFKNGVVDFGLGGKNPQAMPFSPQYHVVYYHPYDYNPKAGCKRWLNFLHEVLPDFNSRLILQMFLGLGLIQRGDAYNKYEGKAASKIELCLLLVGTGANGKSVIFEVACALFGMDRISKMDYADLTADGDEGMRGRFPIRNAIFNWSSDSDPKKFGKKNTGMFKRLVSGEPVPMREIGRNVLESGTLPYLIFNMNELPSSEDVSLGFIRRLQYIGFDVTIPKEKQDPYLAAKIVKEEMSGVFNWVFRGSQELRRRKFVFPVAGNASRLLIKSLLTSHPIAAWVKAYSMRESRMVKGELSNDIPAAVMYESFCNFCEDNDAGEIPTVNKFGREMVTRMGFAKRRMRGGVFYQVFGASEENLKERILVGDIPEEEEEKESFIKDDD